MNDDIDPFYHPVESGQRLSAMSNSALHRLLTDYRWVYTVYNDIAGNAKTRIRALQSILQKRGVATNGTTIPDPHDLSRPKTSGGGVSEHAMLRYLERVKGVDVAAIEREMLQRVEESESYFGGAVRVDPEGVSYIMREDGLVKSVMPSEWVAEAEGIAAAESYKVKRKRSSRINNSLAILD